MSALESSFIHLALTPRKDVETLVNFDGEVCSCHIFTPTKSNPATPELETTLSIRVFFKSSTEGTLTDQPLAS